ncbi:MAG: transcriptional regulator, partial [Candidatus Shapirobacteria bacterium]|nr:transcriptional regulator [Candidatus Shapirobacteria bacterium]
MKVSHRLKSLFTSQTRSKLIAIFFSHITELYYVRELVRLTGEEINSVRRELENMKTSGLISFEPRGNRLYYWSNRDHFLA